MAENNIEDRLATIKKYFGPDKILSEAGIGSSSNAVSLPFAGFDHRGVGTLAKINTDDQGMVFLVRPDLNLSYYNTLASRRLSSLALAPENSLGRAIQVMLSPRLMDKEPVASPIFDNRQAFVTPFTSALVSLSGWPEKTASTEVSPEGLMGEAHVRMVGKPKDLGEMTLTANLYNPEGNIISTIFSVWIETALRCKHGSMAPWVENDGSNTLDYTSRIFHLILDRHKRFVTSIAATGYIFPAVDPTAAKFNFARETATGQDLNQVSISFEGAIPEYDDPILIREFNEIVIKANSDMEDHPNGMTYSKVVVKETGDVMEPHVEYRTIAGIRKPYYTTARRGDYVKLTEDDKVLFNWSGFPRISPEMELEWWVPRDEYENRMDELGRGAAGDESI